jgi:hypothetical protein
MKRKSLLRKLSPSKKLRKKIKRLKSQVQIQRTPRPNLRRNPAPRKKVQQNQLPKYRRKKAKAARVTMEALKTPPRNLLK